MSILSFTYPLTEQIFIKCSVCSRYSSKYQVNRTEQRREGPCLPSMWGRQNKQGDK